MTLAVERWGDGPDLVLVHGWGMNAGVWAPLRDALAARWRVHALELPGHGQSPIVADGDAWVDALLDAAPARAVWLGWSLGGQLALAAASEAADRVRGLALAATNPRFVRAGDWPAGMAAETFHAFAEQLGGNAARTLDRFLALQVRGAEAAGATLRTLRGALRDRPSPRPEALAAGLQRLLNTDLRAPARSLQVPALWVFGGRDALVPSMTADAVGGLMPQARVRVIPAAGHAPFLSHPDTCVDLLNDFAEGLHA